VDGGRDVLISLLPPKYYPQELALGVTRVQDLWIITIDISYLYDEDIKTISILRPSFAKQ